MIMIRSIVRPEKVDDVLAALMEAGFPGVTKMSVVGRGKQRGIKIGEITYDEIPKELLLIVIRRSRQGFRHPHHYQSRPDRRKRRFRRRQDFHQPGSGILYDQLGHQGNRGRRNRRGANMKEIIAIVRMNKMNQTKRALSEAGISSITARDALGRGKGLVDMQLLKGAEKGYEEAISQLGQTQRLVPKRALVIVVPDELVEKTVNTIIRSIKPENPATERFL